MPLDFSEWDYTDRDFFEWYICEKNKLYYKETMYMWPVGMASWMEVKTVKFECRLVGDFANHKIRVGYRIPFAFEDLQADSSYEVSDYEAAKIGLGVLSMTDEEL